MSKSSPTLELIANAVQLDPPFGCLPNRMHETPSAARCIGVSAGSLETDRYRRRWRIAHCKIGSKVLYKEADLMAFLDSCRVEG